MKAENSDDHLCGDEHGVRTFHQPEMARWRSEDVVKVVGDSFSPKPKRTIAACGAEPPLDFRMGHVTTIDQNVNPEGASAKRTCGAEPPLDFQMGHVTTIDQNFNPEGASEEEVQVCTRHVPELYDWVRNNNEAAPKLRCAILDVVS